MGATLSGVTESSIAAGAFTNGKRETRPRPPANSLTTSIWCGGLLQRRHEVKVRRPRGVGAPPGPGTERNMNGTSIARTSRAGAVADERPAREHLVCAVYARLSIDAGDRDSEEKSVAVQIA